MSSQEKKKKEFLWGIPTITKPALIQLSYIYTRFASRFSGMNTHPPIERSRIPPAVFILYLVFSSYFSKTQFHKSLIISPIFSPLSSHQQFFMAELPSTKQIIK